MWSALQALCAAGAEHLQSEGAGGTVPRSVSCCMHQSAIRVGCSSLGQPYLCILRALEDLSRPPTSIRTRLSDFGSSLKQ